MVDYKRRKSKPWHLTSKEIAEVRRMGHEQLVHAYIAQKEQVNRIVRALIKLKQAILEITAAGG